MSSVLFLLKASEDSAGYSQVKSSGLFTSAKLVVDMLRASGIDAVLETVIDGNCIDRLLHKYKPMLVILEALWCPPYKIIELQRLHPRVHWVARIHSELPFLANEGMAIEWLLAYDRAGVQVSANSLRCTEDLTFLKESVYLPNFYAPERVEEKAQCSRPRLDIGCFGAIRPLKNQLAQAIAAIEYARQQRKPLAFHVNGTRHEQGGESVYKNLKALFGAHREHCELVEHPWLSHDKFLALVRDMDLCMNVSFSETFNIVSADAVSQMTPVVASPEVSWLPEGVQADPTSVPRMVRVIRRVMESREHYVSDNWRALHRFTRVSRELWLAFLERVQERAHPKLV